jgi:hypothetical protein
MLKMSQNLTLKISDIMSTTKYEDFLNSTFFYMKTVKNGGHELMFRGPYCSSLFKVWGRRGRTGVLKLKFAEGMAILEA